MKVLGFQSKKNFFDSFFFFNNKFLIKSFLKWMINVCPNWTYIYFEKQIRTTNFTQIDNFYGKI